MTSKPTLIHENEITEEKSLRLQGFIQSSFERMVATFGVPNRVNSRNVSVSWTLKFPDGDIVQIYSRDTVISDSLTCVFRIAGQNRAAVERTHDLYRMHHQLGQHRELTH